LNDVMRKKSRNLSSLVSFLGDFTGATEAMYSSIFA